MHIRLSCLVAVPLVMGAPLIAEDRLSPGIWTNAEDAYFAQEEGRTQADWSGFEIAPQGQWRQIDEFGKPLSEFQSGPIPGLTARSAETGWQIGSSELRKAQSFSCWVSTRKFADKPDGTPDWTFANKLPIFDQGGRVFVPGNSEAPDVTIRLRNVTWAKGSRNKPSLVLYVHKDDPVRAESYSWASPDASLIGINLRWVQGSCALMDQPDAEAQRTDLLAAQGELWRSLYEDRNWEALRSLYADDAVLMTQGQAKIEGADAIIAFLQRVPKAGGSVTFAFDNEAVHASATHGFVTARYRMDIAFPGSKAQVAVGRSFLVYKWQDGAWKLWRDIDNTAPDVTPESFTR